MTIQRIPGSPLFSRAVTHNGIVYLAGVVAQDRDLDIRGQVRDIFNQIDETLALAGVDKSRLLTAQIWLKDIKNDFNVLNEEWTNWVDPNHLPTRVSCESNLAFEDILVEVLVTAAAV